MAKSQKVIITCAVHGLDPHALDVAAHPDHGKRDRGRGDWRGGSRRRGGSPACTRSERTDGRINRRRRSRRSCKSSSSARKP